MSAENFGEYYRLGREEERLTRGYGLVEFARTCELLTRFLPTPSCRVLDVGGGTGTYARWLSVQGHVVTLLDAMPEHVVRAQELGGLEAARLGDARALPFPDASFDALLLLGPMYHLTDHTDRQQALGEAARCLKSGGVLLVAGIPRPAAILSDFSRGVTPEEAEKYFRPLREEAYLSGQYRNPEGRPGYFTRAYFHRPTDLLSEVKQAGFEAEGPYALEGPVTLITAVELEALWMNGPRRTALLDTLRLLEREESLMGMSAHLLISARLPA